MQDIGKVTIFPLFTSTPITQLSTLDSAYPAHLGFHRIGQMISAKGLITSIPSMPLKSSMFLVISGME